MATKNASSKAKKAPAIVPTFARVHAIWFDAGNVIMRLQHDGNVYDFILLDDTDEHDEGAVLLEECENAINEWLAEHPPEWELEEDEESDVE